MVSPGWHANARKNFSHYPFYIAPVGPGLATTIAIAVVGMARSVIEHSTTRLMHHYKRGHVALDSEKAPSQIRLAQAESISRLYPAKTLIPVGFGLVFLQLVSDFIKKIVYLVKGEEL